MHSISTTNFRQNLGVGRYPSKHEKDCIRNYIYEEIVKPRGGNQNHADLILMMSDVLIFKNVNLDQLEIVKITWYENFAPWRFFGLAEYFIFHEHSLQLVSSPVCQEIFWLPNDDGNNAAKAAIALRNAISVEPMLAKLFKFSVRASPTSR